MKRKNIFLTTPYEENSDPCKIPFSDYPRPSMKRDSYLCLNGQWDFAVERNGRASSNKKILVPFPPESRLSGIGERFKKNDVLLYSRTFSLPEGFFKDRVLIHFGAVDQVAEIFINEKRLGTHEGGYLPFSFDITSFLKEGEKRECSV